MKPYYQERGITIYHGDCLTLLPSIDAAVLVTDPPYGMSYKSGWGSNHDAIANDDDVSARDCVLGLWGARPAIIFGRWDQPRPPNVVARLIWSKAPDPGMGDLSFPWGNSDEEIYITGQGFSHKTRAANVISVAKPNPNGREHPTPKPLSLMIHLLERCPPGIIVDPFMGSGTTLLAAKELGRDAIGIECVEKYCALTVRRLSQEVLF